MIIIYFCTVTTIDVHVGVPAHIILLTEVSRSVCATFLCFRVMLLVCNLNFWMSLYFWNLEVLCYIDKRYIYCILWIQLPITNSTKVMEEGKFFLLKTLLLQLYKVEYFFIIKYCIFFYIFYKLVLHFLLFLWKASTVSIPFHINFQILAYTCFTFSQIIFILP